MRRRLLILVLILLVLPAMVATGVQKTKKKSRPRKPLVPVGVTVASGKGAGGNLFAGEPKAGTKRKAVVRSSCPAYEVRRSIAIVQSTSSNKQEKKFGTFEYRCSPTGAWTTSFGCVDNCDPNDPPYIEPPDAIQLRDQFEALTIEPVGRFAPPVHRGAFAITGLRLYVMVTPETYRVISDSATAPGGYYATATVTPGRVTLKANGDEQVCDGPGPDPSTENGRDLSDCYVIMTTVPKGGRETVTVTVDWLIEVTSNVPGIENDAWILERSADTDINVKELQAVGIK